MYGSKEGYASDTCVVESPWPAVIAASFDGKLVSHAQICFGRGTCARFRSCNCLARLSCWSMHFSALHVLVCGSYWKNKKNKTSFLESRIGEVVPSDSIASLPLVYTL